MWLQKNKINNLKIAIKQLNGIVLRPNEIFSYWYLIGNPKKSKGYLPGMVLYNGQVKIGIGGGLCQLSNLIYWLTLHTPLTVIERWRHSYDVFPDAKRTQPFGSGATCAYPNIDLQIINETKQNFQLLLRLDDDYLYGQWLSNNDIEYEYKIIEKSHQIKCTWWGEYIRKNELYKEIYKKRIRNYLKKSLLQVIMLL